MRTLKRALLGVVASAPLLLAIASAPAFGQEDASNRPFRPVTADMQIGLLSRQPHGPGTVCASAEIAPAICKPTRTISVAKTFFICDSFLQSQLGAGSWSGG